LGAVPVVGVGFVEVAGLEGVGTALVTEFEEVVVIVVAVVIAPCNMCRCVEVVEVGGVVLVGEVIDAVTVSWSFGSELVMGVVSGFPVGSDIILGRSVVELTWYGDIVVVVVVVEKWGRVGSAVVSEIGILVVSGSEISRIVVVVVSISGLVVVVIGP
jgi:hypothetical protein